MIERSSRKQLIFFFVIFFVGITYGQNAAVSYAQGESFLRQGKKGKAEVSFEEALKLAQSEHRSDIEMLCHLELAELKNNLFDYKEALEHYRSFTRLYRSKMVQENKRLSTEVGTLTDEVTVRDERIDSTKEEIVRKSDTIQQLSYEQMKNDLKVQKLVNANQLAAMKLERENNESRLMWLFIGFLAVVVAFVLMIYIRKRKSNQLLWIKNNEISDEKAKSDSLLLNILPPLVAEELKKRGKTRSMKFDRATVMFTDFEGFTTFSGANSPEEVVAMLDFYFNAFDRIISRYNIEKIKTIGDAYLCVSGLPSENPEHATEMVRAAIEFQLFVKENPLTRFGKDDHHMEMRIGLHSGPVVAGVVGSKKFAYDIWGDTVNVAARMEQSGEGGKINVSETVVVACGDKFKFTYRGEIEAKNKGKLKMYFVEFQ